MVMRRCPQCGTTSNDIYGFCVKCGREFPKLETNQNACPLCGYSNPDEADYCVKCGTPLILKNQIGGNGSSINPVIIKKVPANPNTIMGISKIGWLILFGYIFSIMGGLLGLIIAIYLATRKDPYPRKHGRIQLAIFAFYIILIAIMLVTGILPMESITNYKQLIVGNITSI